MNFISVFFFSILFWGWSVEGSAGVVRGPVRSGGPWTRGQCFSGYPGQRVLKNHVARSLILRLSRLSRSFAAFVTHLQGVSA